MAEVRIKIRNDLASQFVLANPILSRGEPGFEYDTRKLKIGDGVTAWLSLPYLVEELLQPVSISSIVITQTVAPASPGDGWLWLNPTSGEFSIYTLGAWEPITYKSELADAVAGNLTAADVIDEDTMVSDDSTKVPTQQSVKAYVDAVAASKMSYRGGYDANSNTPNLDTTPTTVNKGDMYKVTIAGTFYAEDLVPGDVLIAEVINPTVYGEWTLIKSTI